MTTTLRYQLRRRWWGRFHRLVRIGWFTARNNPRGSSTQTYIGLGLMGLGLVLRRRKKEVLYSEVMGNGQEFRIKVTQGNRTIFED